MDIFVGMFLDINAYIYDRRQIGFLGEPEIMRGELNMELVKKEIHMNQMKGKIVTQMTLDEDLNVPDTKPDVSRIILSQGDVLLEAVKQAEEKVTVKGKLQFEILYGTEEENGRLQNYVGTAPFEERINYPGLLPGDHVQVKWDIEDMTISIINSRKLRINAIITLELRGESIYEQEAAVEVNVGEEIKSRTKELEVVQLKVQRKDTYRVKEEIEIPGTKPNIDHLLWRGLKMRSVECRPGDGKMEIRGELILFVIYAGEEDHIPMQWMEKSISFQGEVEVPECGASMISATSVGLTHKEIEAKPDYDGENRILGVDAVLELDLKLYEEDRIRILNDVYSPTKEIVPKFGTANFESLLVKNAAKCKITDKIELSTSDKILQICHSSGAAKIDRVSVAEHGLMVEGALSVTILYMSPDDTEPMRSLTGAVPFTHMVEADDINEDCIYEMTPGIEQLSTVMMGNDEVEVRATISLDTLVLAKVEEPMIISAEELPLQKEKLEAMPGIVGYIVKNGDSLWDVAKKFYTTEEAVVKANNLTSTELKPGQRILLVKKAEQL